MSYVLYGSFTSPFTRRLRMLMEHIPYTFEELRIYENDGPKLNQINPVNQIPVLKDGEQMVWDSRIIFNYLNSKHQFESMNIVKENRLTAIDGATTAGTSLLLLKRSGIDTNHPYMITERYKFRIEQVLDYLKPFLDKEALENWDFTTMSLYSFLDWALFRKVITIDKRPECQKFLETYKDKPIVKETAIKE